MATALSDDTGRPDSRGSGYSDEDDEMTGIRVRGSDPASSGTETQARENASPKRPRRDPVEECFEQFNEEATSTGYPNAPVGFYRKDSTAGFALFRMAFQFFEAAYPDHPSDEAQRFGLLAVLVGPDRALEDFQQNNTSWRSLVVNHGKFSSLIYNGRDSQQNQELAYMRDFFYKKVSFAPDIRDAQGIDMPVQVSIPAPRYESTPSRIERIAYEVQQMERADNEFRDQIRRNPSKFPLSADGVAATTPTPPPLADLGATMKVPRVPIPKSILKPQVQPLTANPLLIPSQPAIPTSQPTTTPPLSGPHVPPHVSFQSPPTTQVPRVIPTSMPLYYTTTTSTTTLPQPHLDPSLLPNQGQHHPQGFRPVSTSPAGSDIEEIQRPPSSGLAFHGLGRSSSTHQPHLLDQQNQEFFTPPATHSRRHQQNPYGIRPVAGFNSFLPDCGQILNPEFAYQDELRTRRPLPTYPEESGSARLARTLDQARILRSDPMWGYSLAMYESFRQAQEKKSKPEFTVARVSKPTYEGMNLDYFDYNNQGQTPEEILGSRFRGSIFPTENARKETMKQIFQRCIDNPTTSPVTFNICTQQLGKSNPSRDHIDGLDQSMVRTLQLLTRSGLSTDEDLQIIPPPVLGNRHEFGPAIVKNLYSSLGMAPGTKFCPTKPDSTPLSHFLPTLSSSITNNQLGREGAYSLLLSILEGDLYTEMHGALTKGVPFERTWIYIQKTNGGKIQKDVLVKELTKTFNTAPSGNNPVSSILTRLQNLREKYYSDTHPASVRKIMIEETTVRDFLNYVAQHYKGEASAIETRYHEAKLAKETEQQLLLRQGYPVDDTYSNIWLLKEIISTHLSRPTMITGGLSLAFSNMSVEEGAPTIPSIQQFTTTVSPASSEILALQARIASMEAAQHSARQSSQKPKKNSNQQASGLAGIDVSTLQAFNQVFDSVRSIQQQNEQSAAVIDQLRNQQQQLLLQNQYQTQQAQQHQQTQQQQAPVQQQQAPMQAPASNITNPLFGDHMGPPYPNSTDPNKKNILSHPNYPVQYNSRGELKFPSICWDKMGKGICFLCAGLDHLVKECTIYGPQYPVPIQCGCLGFHFTPCVANKTPTAGAILHCQNRALEMQTLNQARQNMAQTGGYDNSNRGSANPRFNRGSNHGGRSRGGRGRGGYNGNQGQGGHQNQFQNQGQFQNQNQQQGQAQNMDANATMKPNINMFQGGQTLSYPQGVHPTAPQAAQTAQRAGTALGNAGTQPIATNVIMNTGLATPGFN